MTTDAERVGYRDAARITRAHGTTYYWGTRLLPRQARRHVFALYALARRADDIVDDAGPQPGPRTAQQLQEFERAFWHGLQHGHPPDPLLACVVATIHELRIETSCFERFFNAMRMDLTVRAYPTWEDLLAYMDGSAAVIGEMMLPVLEPSSPQARPAARALGLAFQLTNFLRDVGEDLDRGRVYLPQQDLARFGADPHRRVNDPAWQALMRFQIERNRALYQDADRGLSLLPLRARRCVVAARTLYSGILDEIEAADYDVFDRRAALPTRRKIARAARVAVHRRPETLTSPR